MSVNFTSNFSYRKNTIFLTLLLTFLFFASAVSTRAAGELDQTFAGGGITPAPAPNSFAAVSVVSSAGRENYCGRDLFAVGQLSGQPLRARSIFAVGFN